MTGLRRRRAGVALETHTGAAIAARQVALGTNVFPSLLRRVSLHTVPVYDYVLMTEPLTPAQLDSIGWRSRAGVGDSANQFHYYRLTEDNRILWGGYDAVYHYGRRVQPSRDQRPETFDRLAEHFFETFPQLEGLRFTHRWGGAIDTCTRFCAFFGTAMRGRVAYALGYTGLGVGATRFGARVMLDLLDGRRTEATGARDGAPPPAAVPAGALGLGGDPAHPVVAGPRRRATRAGATSGCAPSTAWASASTPRPGAPGPAPRGVARPGRRGRSPRPSTCPRGSGSAPPRGSRRASSRRRRGRTRGR